MLWRKWLIGLNNRITRRRRVRASASGILLLLPHCLQKSDCPHRVVHDMDACVRCGRCDMAGLLKIRDETGVQSCVVAGGRQALERVRRPEIKAVVAVACEKELVDGIRLAFPKPVLAVCLSAPCGYCKDTRVDLEALRATIREFMPDPA